MALRGCFQGVFFFYRAPFYPSLWRLLSFCLGSCYVVEYCIYIFFSCSYVFALPLISFIQRWRQLTIHFFTLYAWWESKLFSGECWITVYVCLESMLYSRYQYIRECCFFSLLHIPSDESEVILSVSNDTANFAATLINKRTPSRIAIRLDWLGLLFNHFHEESGDSDIWWWLSS